LRCSTNFDGLTGCCDRIPVKQVDTNTPRVITEYII
jgi:hypothetical protein